MTFREYMKQVKDDVLLKAFEEYQELCNNGVLPDGVAREIWQKCNEICETSFPLGYVEKEVYFELAMRYYNSKN